jgi:hypothetical protein
MNIEKGTKMYPPDSSTSHVGKGIQDGRMSPRHTDTRKKGERSRTGKSGKEQTWNILLVQFSTSSPTYSFWDI